MGTNTASGNGSRKRLKVKLVSGHPVEWRNTYQLPVLTNVSRNNKIPGGLVSHNYSSGINQ